MIKKGINKNCRIVKIGMGLDSNEVCEYHNGRIDCVNLTYNDCDDCLIKVARIAFLEDAIHRLLTDHVEALKFFGLKNDN